MKYIIQMELDADIGAELEETPEKIQEMIGTWQALNPIGMYFALTRRAVTIILEAANEDVFFEALHKAWIVTDNYPEVWPVASVEEFPALLKRVGVVR